MQHTPTPDAKRAYVKSKELLALLAKPQGFVASSIDIDNYHRVFSRDGVIASIAGLLIGDKVLTKAAKQTMLTLAKYQDHTGRIVSNVSLDGTKVSYGTQVGRVDATPWFVIGVGQYSKRMHDQKFAKKMYPKVAKAMHYLAALELNGKGLIYVPYGGDWADEYLNHGYVLYDELLYLQAQREYLFMQKTVKKRDSVYTTKKKKFLEEQILANYLPSLAKNYVHAIYNRSKALERYLLQYAKPYALPYFVQGGVGEYFDAYANSLLLLLAPLPKETQDNLTQYMSGLLRKQKQPILPAFHPVITDRGHSIGWKMLQMNYLFRMKNKPHHYHNGGLWPLIQGFFIAALSHEQAIEYVEQFAHTMKKHHFQFHEYFDGKFGKPHGTRHLGFSASAYILAYETAYHRKKIFL